MTARVGLIGYPLKHSISPVFQQAAFDHLGLDVRYEPWETRPEQVADVLGRLRGREYLGLNVTIPHKETVLPLVDDVEPWARRLGSVNTVVKREGRLQGHNTDAAGFLRALRAEGEFEPAGRCALILGAGGAARAVVGVLYEAGCARLTIANRDRRRAERLADELAPWGAGVGVRPPPQVEVADWSPAVLNGEVVRADLIVNCTPLGMRHSPGEDRTPLEGIAIPKGLLVYDLVYVPAETPLLRAARESGSRPLGGLAMLVYQGAAAFELWTGRQAPVQVMMNAARIALGL